MNYIMFCTEGRKRSTKLWPAIASNGRWPAKVVEPINKDRDDCVRRERAYLRVQRITTPVVDANQMLLISICKQVEATCCMGYPKCEEGGGVFMGLNG